MKKNLKIQIYYLNAVDLKKCISEYVLFTWRSYQLAVAYLYTSSKVPANEEFETFSWLKLFSVCSVHHTDEGKN
jgi:hypothetical protein